MNKREYTELQVSVILSNMIEDLQSPEISSTQEIKISSQDHFREQDNPRFETLNENNVEEFMTRRLTEFSNRYTELYTDKIGYDAEQFSKSIVQKIKDHTTGIEIEKSKNNSPIVASYNWDRISGKGKFLFKPHADQPSRSNTKTIYHEFLHALGMTKRKGSNGEEDYSTGVQFDYERISHFNPLEEGFTEIIAAEMAEIPPQNYTYEVPVCGLIRNIIGDENFLAVKNGNLDPLLSEFSYKQLEELKIILATYNEGLMNRFSNSKYINKDKQKVEIQSTETITNDFLAKESYISANANLTEFLTDHFSQKINSVTTQEEASNLAQIFEKLKTTEQKVLPPGNHYESSIPAINQAIINSHTTLVKHCEANNLRLPETLINTPQFNYSQEQNAISIGISTSDIQLMILEKDISNLEQKKDKNPNERILLRAYKWIHASIETQKEYRRLFPGRLNKHFAYPKQLEAIQELVPNFDSKYKFPSKQGLGNITDHTHITNRNISFTKAGYHGTLPDYGFLIAQSLNIESLKKIFGDYALHTFYLAQQENIPMEYDEAGEHLETIKGFVMRKELEVIKNAKSLSQKTDSLPIDLKTTENIKQLGDLRAEGMKTILKF